MTAGDDLPPVEDLVMAHLDGVVYTDTALPEDTPELPWTDIYPFAVLNRLPAGGIDPDGLTDRALVGFIVVGETRNLAQKAARAVTARMLNDGDPFTVTLDGVDWEIEPTEQVVAGAEELDVNPDNRFIELTFWFPVSLRF